MQFRGDSGSRGESLAWSRYRWQGSPRRELTEGMRGQRLSWEAHQARTVVHKRCQPVKGLASGGWGGARREEEKTPSVGEVLSGHWQPGAQA